MTPSTRNRILNYLSVLTEMDIAQQVAKGIGTTTRETGQHLHLLWLEGSVELHNCHAKTSEYGIMED